MNVLVIGSGGREHALCLAISKSPALKNLYAMPGNPGIASVANMVNLSVAPDNFNRVCAFCADNKIDLVVVGPEAPLADGIADCLTAAKIPVFGPQKNGALLESSKSFAKDFMQRHKIPTAGHFTARSRADALDYLNRCAYPIVVKADGLAAGKGVRVCENKEDAMSAVADYMDKKVFGPAGLCIVFEEFLKGKELSVMGIIDGKNYVLLSPSRDHKRLLDGDKGPNTGGMGAYSPVPDADDKLIARVRAEVFDRFIDGIKKDGIDYRGVLYAGLMLTDSGPKVIEFNCRFGDPETQVILPLLKSDALELFKLSADGNLGGYKQTFHRKVCVSIVLAAGGYPDNPQKGKEILGLDNNFGENVSILHCGVKFENGKYYTNGGRVLNVVAVSDSLKGASMTAYRAIEGIRFEGMQYRKDIGYALTQPL